MIAWDILVSGSTAPAGSTAWDHLNAQSGESSILPGCVSEIQDHEYIDEISEYTKQFSVSYLDENEEIESIDENYSIESLEESYVIVENEEIGNECTTIINGEC